MTSQLEYSKPTVAPLLTYISGIWHVFYHLLVVGNTCLHSINDGDKRCCADKIHEGKDICVASDNLLVKNIMSVL